jgi:hypothetical protein
MLRHQVRGELAAIGAVFQRTARGNSAMNQVLIAGVGMVPFKKPGQERSLPFERLHSLHHCDEPFPRDEAVGGS